jgi:hypothetical protein
MHHQILVCGTDRLLLSTRRDVLRTAGYAVFIVPAIDAIERILQGCSVDALVLCHTLAPEQQQAVLTLLHRSSPAAKSVIMTKVTAPESCAVPDATVCATEGPGALIRTLDRLLNYDVAAQATQLGVPLGKRNVLR